MTVFPPLTLATARWRPASGDGLEHLDLRSAGDDIIAEGVIVGARDAPPYGVNYRIVCDAGWRTRLLHIHTTAGRSVRLTSDGDGHWTDDGGSPMPNLDGCIDVDLAGSPFTNTLPIRRADLTPETGAVEFRMVYIPFATFEPAVDEQRYICLEAARLYRYEAVDRSFAADLTVDEDGLVVDYPTLFHRVAV